MRDRPRRATLTIAVLDDGIGGLNVMSVLEAHAAQTLCQTPHIWTGRGREWVP